jgi:hypothetical protein
MTVTPVALRTNGGRRVGGLTLVRGYRLTSPDRAFGGFSSLLVDGDRFTLLNDGGDLVRFRLDQSGHASDIRFGTLPALPGTGYLKEDRDSESMARDPATGTIWVGFENWNAIWRYDAGLARVQRWAIPPAMRDWPANGGPESIARLADGRFVVLAEQQEGPNGAGRVGLVFDRDPTVTPRLGFRFVYQPPDGFDPSDAAQLPDGRLVILNRRFRLTDGFAVIVTIVDPRTIRPVATVSGSVVARFMGDVLHDNYEGIAVARDRGRDVLWIVSDDNQSVFQQTLLLEFTLDLPKDSRQAAN